MNTKVCDLAIIGGGPAGIAAAQTAAFWGASVVLIDDAPELGGHYYKEAPPNFSGTALKRLQKKQRELNIHKDVLSANGAEVLLGTRVWGVFDETGNALNKRCDAADVQFLLQLDHNRYGFSSILARWLILSPGVYDRPIPFPGWDLPGVLTPGAVQILLEKQGLLPGKRVLVGGTGPLQLLIAADLVRQGVEVVAVVDSCAALDGMAQLPGAFGGLWSRLGDAGGSLFTLVRHGVPVLFRHAVYRAMGQPETGVQKVIIGKVDAEGRPIPGSEKEFAVDAICVAHGFLPSIAMTLHLGCKHRYDQDLQGFVPEYDNSLQTSVPGVFVAGDVTGSGGKPLSELQGKLAAISVLTQMGRVTREQAEGETALLAPQIRREEQFARWLWRRCRVRPGLLQLADEDTVLCRCEAVNMRQFRESLDNGGNDFFGVKLRTRLGMGQCQGRYCAPNAALLIAQNKGSAPTERELPSIRPPIFPIRLSSIGDGKKPD